MLKARDFRRNLDNGGRWNQEEFDKFVGVPGRSAPASGEGNVEIRSNPIRSIGLYRENASSSTAHFALAERSRKYSWVFATLVICQWL